MDDAGEPVLDRATLAGMDAHAAADAEFGPCLIPDCPGSVWAAGHPVDQMDQHTVGPAVDCLDIEPTSRGQ